MSKQRFQAGKAPLILVNECQGDLVIRPWMELDVQAKGSYQAEESADKLTFTADGDLVLHVPQQSSLHLETGWGDVVVRSITGDVSLNSVVGDLVLSNLKQAKVGHVTGDLVARNVSGSLSVLRVEGDIVVRNLDGDLAVERVNGDLSAQYVSGAVLVEEAVGDINVRSIGGDLQVKEGRRDTNVRNLGGLCTLHNVAGDVRLMGGLGANDHSLRAQGDCVLIWPADLPLLVEAAAPVIDNRLPLLDVKQTETSLSGRLGDGKTRLTIASEGRVVLKEAEMVSKKWNMGDEPLFDFDFISELANLGAKISSEVNEQVTRVTAEMENNFGPDFMARMAGQVSQKAAEAAAKAQKAAEQAAPRAADAAPSRKKANAGAAYEAQLKILKMVEEGVISPDEAAVLLEALQGD